MPIRELPNTDLSYCLLNYDKDGIERKDDPDATEGQLSQTILSTLSDNSYTDIFFMAHGWKSDIPAAVSQFDDWYGAMLGCTEDIARLQNRPQGFKPMVIGLHWPSLPFGVETYDETLSFDLKADSYESLLSIAMSGIANNAEEAEAVKAIFEYAYSHSGVEPLPSHLKDGIDALIKRLGKDDDLLLEAMDWDADSLYTHFSDPSPELIDFGGSGLGPLLGLLTQLSVWTMKGRARRFGESGGAKLLRALMETTNEDTAFHLMGHSFGTIVVSSAVLGKSGYEPLPRPIDSLFLVQGAVSFWSFCKSIPIIDGKPGYFQNLSDPEYVRGPIITTQSYHDVAVRNMYPLMSMLASENVSFEAGELPMHGALGTFGARGEGIVHHQLSIKAKAESYSYLPGEFFNLESSHIIKQSEGMFSGAHNDIAHPEVAHAFWEAIR